jgi:predicted nucleic acid-binding protein
MLVYLDSCCYNRPFDNQDHERVILETEAILAILERCERKKDWLIVGSDVLLSEIRQNTDPRRQEKLMLLYSLAPIQIDLDDSIVLRAEEFERHNIKSFDALHLASAERANADVLLTTDIRFIKAAKRTNANIDVKNPLIWLWEVMNVS